MARDPAFLFYANDFEIRTKFFTHEQVGRYIRILITQFQFGHLTRAQIEQVAGWDDMVMEKFDRDSAGLYYQERLELEINKRLAYSESRKKNVSKRYTCTTHEATHVDGVNLQGENENENNNKNYKEGIVKGRPTLDMVRDMFKSLGAPEEAEPFFDHYEANGWKMGLNEMQSWPAACKSWLRSPYRTKVQEKKKDPPPGLKAEEERKKREREAAPPPPEFTELLKKTQKKLTEKYTKPEKVA